MNLLLTPFLASCIALFPQISVAQDCKFNYWQVIPKTTPCEIFQLPDFRFKRLPLSRPKDDPLRKFCKDYEVISSFGKQIVGYCYTGAGDRFGPVFRLGDPKWNYSQKDKTDRIYLADLTFTGCFDGEETEGIVFVQFGWSKAPKFIGRARPLEGVKASCKSR